MHYITNLIKVDNLQGALGAIAFMAGTFIFIAFLFIKFPLTIAGKLLPKDGDDKLDWQLTGQDVYSIAFFILGLYILINAIPSMFYWLAYSITYKNSDPPAYQEFSPGEIGGMVVTVTKLIIGIWLLLGARGLRGLVYKLRYAGLDSKTNDNSE